MRRNPWLFGGDACGGCGARRGVGHEATLAAIRAIDAAPLVARRDVVGRYSGAFSGTFTLGWTQSGSILRGSITLSSPHGKYGIGGSVKGNAINFGAVGVGATYTGSVSGKSMSGSYKSPQGGGRWSARKTS